VAVELQDARKSSRRPSQSFASLSEVRVSAGMPARHELISSVDPKLAVAVDRHLLFSALGNLLQNARRKACSCPSRRPARINAAWELGLSIARRSVEANNGVLSVRNLPGLGCVFTIDLPRHCL
jgi:signal transduction histidine kinase